jgi:hypothetical protein
MPAADHQVWEVYDLWRTARLNHKYFCELLRRVQLESKVVEIVVAVAAPGSAIAAFAFWDEPAGQKAWKALLIIAAIVGFLKPWFGHEKRIAKYAKLVDGYQTLDHDLMKLSLSIHRDQQYNRAHQDQFRDALERKGVLVKEEAEVRLRKSLRRKYQQEVSTELPTDSFHIPPETDE